MDFFNVDAFTVFFLAFIIIAAILCTVYINNSSNKDRLIQNRRIIEQMPSAISTLGVLGTFIGITRGLLYFDSNDLTTSIPILLEGLKTAFFTSVTGMVCSLALSTFVGKLYDKKDGGISDINMAAGQIVKAVESMSLENRETLKELKEQAKKQSIDQLAFYRLTSDLLTEIKTQSSEITSNVNSLVLHTQQQSSSIEGIKDNIGSISVSMGNIEENSSKQISISNDIHTLAKENNNSMSEIVDISSAISSTEEGVADEVKKFGEKLHGEVVEIEDKMTETNKLLESKFDEFTELLKKSNTEALVEVMKRVTEEFQKSMNELIGKLIQENFDQLNKSVENLNTWQQENKEMISSLTSQYKEMATNFENTSTALTTVEKDTKSLVGDGGKLQQLIDALKKVMIDDEKFITITTNLTNAVNLTKDNMTEFESSTKALNEWVRKQRNFVDGVQMLISKLEELNKIKDYNEEFWKNTKRSLEEGVGYISQGSKSLQDQIVNLDAKFYSRLSTTLAELDTCIQAMVKGRR